MITKRENPFSNLLGFRMQVDKGGKSHLCNLFSVVAKTPILGLVEERGKNFLSGCEYVFDLLSKRLGDIQHTT